MNNILGIKKLDLSGFTSYEPLVRFFQENEWNNTNYCLSIENGYTNLNGININGSNNSNTIAMNNPNKNMAFSTYGTGHFIFYNENIERLHITNIGNIGIGISNPSYKLDVNGSINASSIYKNNIELDNIYLNINNNQWIRNGSNIYTDTSLNISNVGIGITNPYGNLHIGSPTINNSDGTLILSKRNINTSNRNFKIGYDNNFNFCMGDFGKDTDKIWTQQLYINSNAASNSLVINNNSFIGIGISNPSYKLDVNGVINASSFIGNGSNIINIDYNKITSNKPELSNLNNWIKNNSTIYNNINNIAIGTTEQTSYKLNVNGTINSTDIFRNNININNIFLSSATANADYLKITDATTLYNSWTKQTDGTIYLTSYTNDNNAVIIGDIVRKSGITAKLYLYGNLYADSIISGNGANIKNIDYNNVVNKPNIYTVNEIENIFYTKNYLDNTYYNYVIKQSSNSFSTLRDYQELKTSIDLFLNKGLDPNVLSEAITSLVNNQDIKIQYEKINLNPLVLTRSTATSPNIITYNGNFIATNSYATDFFENNINIKNIYVSYNTFNEVAKNYDTIVERKKAIMSSCNIYPPQIEPLLNYSNLITTSPHGNGLYIANASIFNNDNTKNNSVHRIFSINKNNLDYIWTSADNKPFNNYSGNADIGYTYREQNNQSVGSTDNGREIVYTQNGTINIYGHWVQLYYINGFVINSFSIKTYYTIETVNDDNNNLNYTSMYSKLPRTFFLLATNDPTLLFWDTLNYTSNLNNNSSSNIYYKSTLNNITYDIDKNANTISVDIQLPYNVINYKYYRLIFTQTIAAPEVAISEIIFYGAENKIEWINSSSNIYYMTGNVGIGTVNDISIYKLNINGSTYINSNIIVNSNIGIGNTIPIANLHIGDHSLSNSDGSIVVSKYNINNNNFKIGYDSNFNFIFGDYKKLSDNSYLWNSQFYIHSNATSNSLIIDTNGNIGINTNITNNYKLNVLGDTYISGKLINNTSIGIGTLNTEGKQLFVNGNSTFTGTINQTTYSDINLIGNIYATCNINVSNINTINLNSSSSIIVNGIITANSNVGIGITIPFNETLHIESTSNIIGIWNGSLTMNNNSYISSFIGKNTSNGFYNKYTHINNNSINNYLTWGISNNSSILSLTSNGYIGIGITNPTNIFQINDGGRLRISNDFNDYTLLGTKDGIDNNNTRIVINGSNKSGSIGDIEYRTTNTGNHLFYSYGNTEIIRFMSSGNISIGTNNPNNYKLNINGSTYINSNIIVNSNIGIGNTIPIANLHIGDPSLSNSDGSIVVSKYNINNNNFKIGYDSNFNFIFGDYKKLSDNSYLWKKQFYIHSNATSNSLIIDTNGNIGINTNITNNYKLNILGDTYISGKLINNTSIGIGTLNTEGKQLFVNGATNIIGQTDIQGSIFQSLGNIVLGDVNSYIGIGGNYDINYKLKILGNTNINGNLIQTSGNVVFAADNSSYYVGIGGTYDPSYKLKVSGNTYFTGDITSASAGFINNYLCIATTSNPNSYKLIVNGTANVVGNLIQSGSLNNVFIEGKMGIGVLSSATLNSNFNVNGTSYFSSNVNIDGALTQSGTSNITFNGSTTINNTLAVAGILNQTIGGVVSLSGKTTINSNLVISGNNILYATGKVGVSYADNATLNSNFNVNGTSYFSSNVNINGSTTINNTLAIAGILNQTVGGVVSLSGKTTINSNLVISGNNILYATGKVGVSYADNATLNSNFNVNGTSYFSSNVNIDGALTQSGTSNITFNGSTTINNTLAIAGILNQTVGGVVSLSGKTTINSNLVISGNNILYATGKVGVSYADNATLNSNFNVNGTSYFSSNVNINGALTQSGTSNITFNGSTTINNTLAIAGILNQTVGGVVSLSGKTTINSNLVISGNNILYATGKVGVSYADNATLNSNFNVNGTSYFSSNVNINGSTTINNSLAVAGLLTQTIGGVVSLSGKTTINSNLVISGNNILYATGKVGVSYVDNATLNSNFNVNGTAFINSDITIGGKITQIGGNNVSLSGITTVNSNLIISGNINNQISISNNSENGFASIIFNNNNNNIGYIGIGGTNTYYYSNNLYLQTDRSIVFNSGINNSSNIPNMIIYSNGNIGIGTINPNNIFQIGDGGRMRIANNNYDYTLIGTKDGIDNNNTRIVINGNTYSSSLGNIEYRATTGNHIFYTNGNTEVIRINNTGELLCTNKIKENSKYLGDIYLNSNLLNNIKKKYGFLCAIGSANIQNINGINYYKYDIDLNKYTQTKIINSCPYRIFNIKAFMTDGYFNLFNSNIPNILQYDVYMCNESSANINFPGSSSGINICAVGTPENYRLTNILPTYFTILQNSTIDKLTIVSTTSNLNISCIIEDYLF